MKKSLIILIALMAVSTVFAFQSGSLMFGGQIGYSSYKASNNDDALTAIVFAPQISRFVMENLSADLILSYASSSQGKNSNSSFGIGVGGRYFFKNIYGGLDFTYEVLQVQIPRVGVSQNAMYLTPKIGYLAPIAPNTYVDLQARYKLGVGKYSGNFHGDNEESNFGILVGLQVNYGL